MIRALHREALQGMSDKNAGEEFDYIVVGAGSAGCAVAARLSEDPSARVLLFEAGPADRDFWIHLPIGYYRTIFNPKFSWGFKTEPEPGLNGRTIPWPRGKVLGGCSSINGLAYVRGQARGLRPLAPARQCRLVLRGSAALLPAVGELRRRRRRLSRPERAPACDPSRSPGWS